MILVLLACASEEALRIPATLRSDFSSSVVELELGLLGVQDLHLVDAQGLEVGRVPGETELDLLGEALQLQTAELWPSGWTELRGEITQAELQGQVQLQDGPLSFELALGPDLDGRIYGGEVLDERPSEEIPPGQLTIGFDALLALASLDWSAGDVDGDGLLTESDGDNGAVLAFGLRSGLAWTASIQEAE